MLLLLCLRQTADEQARGAKAGIVDKTTESQVRAAGAEQEARTSSYTLQDRFKDISRDIDKYILRDGEISSDTPDVQIYTPRTYLDV